MATLREAIKGRMNKLLAQSAALSLEHNEKQAEIAAVVAAEEATLSSLGVFLDQELSEAKKGIADLFANFETPESKSEKTPK